MSTDLISPEGTDIVLRREEAMDAACRYAHHSLAESTWRTYERAWRIFQSWCATVSLSTLPAEPDTVVMPIGAPVDDGLAPATLAHRLSGNSTDASGARATIPTQHTGRHGGHAWHSTDTSQSWAGAQQENAYGE